MSWVIKSIISVLLGWMGGMFATLCGDFVSNIGINIGANFPTLTKSASLSSILSSYPQDYGVLTSVFDTLFPITSFKSLFVILSITIAAILFIFEIVKVFTSPLAGNRKQHPIKSVAKFAGTVFLVIFSYRIFIVFEYVANSFYLKFAEMAIGITKDSAAAKTLSETLTEDSIENGITTSYTHALTGTTHASTSSSNITADTTADAGLTLLALVLIMLLFFNFLKLLIELVERYVVLGMLFYTCPLPFSTLVSESTSNIFGSWVRMVASEMLLIITNSLFLNVFIRALLSMGSLKSSSNLTWIIYIFMLLGWLKVAQHFDDYLEGLGLNTAQTGRGLAGDIFGAVGTAVSMSKNIGRGIAKNNSAKSTAAANAARDTANTLKNTGASVAPAIVGARNAAGQTAMNSKSKLGDTGDKIFGSSSVAKQGEPGFVAAQKTALDAMNSAGAGNPAIAKSIQDAAAIENGDGMTKITHDDGSISSIAYNGNMSSGIQVGQLKDSTGNGISPVMMNTDVSGLSSGIERSTCQAAMTANAVTNANMEASAQKVVDSYQSKFGNYDNRDFNYQFSVTDQAYKIYDGDNELGIITNDANAHLFQDKYQGGSVDIKNAVKFIQKK